MPLEKVADTRLSDSLTIRVAIDEKKHEDFVGDDDIFYMAFVNNTVWSGEKVIPEERYLVVYRYDDEDADEDGNIEGKVVAMFPAKAYSYARTV